MNRNYAFALISMLLVAVSPLCQSAPEAAESVDGYDIIARMGKGFIIWESNRTGAWRLWRIELNGQGLKQISPDEPDRDHYCPHISPNGRKLIYLSYPKEQDTYHEHPEKSPAVMHIMNTDGSGDRVLISSARAYAEDRAVVWVDDDRFNYIDGTGMSQQYSISNGQIMPLVKQTKAGYGWLVNATMTYAVTGEPTFCPYDRVSRNTSSAKAMDGCQPYFTADGKWGFWMGGAGGPINRYELATGIASPILVENDSRMPKDRHYLYFPMVSRNSRLLAFGASPGQHDHFQSDYDIFVARIDPATLQVIGNPVRYSFDPGCDRFPDVYVADLELGSHQGEAPYTLQLKAPAAVGNANWSFGDGNKATGAVVKHTYNKAGKYSVVIDRPDHTYNGEVNVESAHAPSVVAVTLRGDHKVSVSFNEPVSISKATFKMNNKIKAKSAMLDREGLNLELNYSLAIPQNAKLVIDGIVDRAQVPNKMATKQYTIQAHVWPIDPASLVLLWDNAKTACTTAGSAPCETQAVGRAYTDHGYAMRTSGGYYKISGADESLIKGCMKTNKLTIEAVITSDSAQQTGPARIITFSSGASSRNFTLGQEGNRLILRLRTTGTGENGTGPQLELGEILPNRATHVMICYSPGSLQCYIDGKLTLNSNLIQGDFSNWSAQHLLLGNEWEADRAWKGAVNGLAIYNQKYGANQVARSFESYRALHPSKTVSQVILTARFVNRSKLPTLAEITPYREGLVTSLYDVLSVVDGKCDAKQILVVQWAIIGGEQLESQGTAGSSQTLTLEPYADNPQLEGIYMSDTLGADAAIPIYYAPPL